MARFQLHRNPFGELTRAERAELAVVDVSAYLDFLDHPRAALQFIGNCGHGKTTHLLALERALTEQRQAHVGFVYFPEDGTQPTLPLQRPLLVDEAQRMGWRRRHQLLRGEGPLVIGTHIDLSRALQQAGFRPWTVDLDQPIDVERLRQLLNRRILASRLTVSGSETMIDEGFHPLCLSRDQVVALQQRFGSNVRSIEHYLYDALQRFALEGEPWLPVS